VSSANTGYATGKGGTLRYRWVVTRNGLGPSGSRSSVRQGVCKTLTLACELRFVADDKAAAERRRWPAFLAHDAER
jgi:hypothetical protein